MVSDYLNHSRSIEELDELFKQDRITAALVAEAAFKNTVIVGKAGVSEAQQVASARILADTQVATAKITVDAYVTSKLLATSADATMLDIQEKLKSENAKNTDHEKLHDMVAAVGDRKSTEISEYAALSIKRIESEAQGAVERIRSLGAEAIHSLDSIAASIQKQILVNSENAKLKLDEEKLLVRVCKDTIEDAEDAAAKVENERVNFTKQVLDAVEHSIEEINSLADKATSDIRACVEGAELNVSNARKAALNSVAEIVDFMQKKSL
jgi:hypothetical protein